MPETIKHYRKPCSYKKPFKFTFELNKDKDVAFDLMQEFFALTMENYNDFIKKENPDTGRLIGSDVMMLDSYSKIVYSVIVVTTYCSMDFSFILNGFELLDFGDPYARVRHYYNERSRTLPRSLKDRLNVIINDEEINAVLIKKYGEYSPSEEDLIEIEKGFKDLAENLVNYINNAEL